MLGEDAGPARGSGLDRGYAPAMVHLRIVAPAGIARRVIAMLEQSPAVVNVILFEGVARKPVGDLVLCDVAREEASIVIADLRRLRVHELGAITILDIDTQISAAAIAAEKAAAGLPGDAVVWEEVEARTSENTELSFGFIAFMLLACLIASVGVLLDSPILIIGAMVIGPEFGPIAALCVAAVERRADVARRSLKALGVGFPLGILTAFIFTVIVKALDLPPHQFTTSAHPLTNFISHPDAFSFIVALIAGSAGVLSLTTAKSGALVGVLISVTTIPAAANIGVAAAYTDWHECVGAVEQLAANLVGIFLAGILTLYLQRRSYVRRRSAHLADSAEPEHSLTNSHVL
jgi:uncharacterized hydrophobic protein (TIGR00271 family)